MEREYGSSRHFQRRNNQTSKSARCRGELFRSFLKRTQILNKYFGFGFKERHYKNLQYQRELKEQIEQKRKEAEERKAREIEAEERLTR